MWCNRDYYLDCIPSHSGYKIAPELILIQDDTSSLILACVWRMCHAEETSASAVHPIKINRSAHFAAIADVRLAPWIRVAPVVGRLPGC